MLSLVLFATLAVDPPKPVDPMKGLLKDAANAAATSTDGGVVEWQGPGPDPSKLPFTPDSIKQIVAAYQPRIQECHESQMAAKDKHLEGKLVTSWVIQPDGTVKKPAVNKKASSLKDPHLNDCVIAVLSSMQFPKPSDKKDHPIEFPFNLKTIK